MRDYLKYITYLKRGFSTTLLSRWININSLSQRTHQEWFQANLSCLLCLPHKYVSLLSILQSKLPHILGKTYLVHDYGEIVSMVPVENYVYLENRALCIGYVRIQCTNGNILLHAIVNHFMTRFNSYIIFPRLTPSIYLPVCHAFKAKPLHQFQ